MKKLMKKAGILLANTKFKASCYALVAANAVSIVQAQAFSGDRSTGDSIVKTAIDAIVGLFPWVGAFFVVSGAFKLVMAYRGENPEAQTGAAKDIVIGAVLIIFKAFIWESLAAIIFGS